MLTFIIFLILSPNFTSITENKSLSKDILHFSDTANNKDESLIYIEKKCSHNPSHLDLTKHFTHGANRRVSSTQIQEKYYPIRMHFDYSYTLPEEEEMLKKIIMPPVQKFFESAIKVKRSPGKLKFPRNMSHCQRLKIPSDLIEKGVDADIMIIVSTFKGMNKRIYEELKKDMERKEAKVEERRQKAESQSSEKKGSDSENVSNSEEEIDLEASLSFLKIKEKLKNTLLGKDTSKVNKINKHDCNDEPDSLEPWEREEPPAGIVGWASRCLQDTNTLRPVGGVIQFVDNIKLDQRNVEETIWTAIHELTHVFVMDYDLIQDFVKEDYTKYKINELLSVYSSLEGLQELIDENKDFLNNKTAILNYNITESLNNETDSSNSSKLSISNIAPHITKYRKYLTISQNSEDEDIEKSEEDCESSSTSEDPNEAEEESSNSEEEEEEEEEDDEAEETQSDHPSNSTSNTSNTTNSTTNSTTEQIFESLKDLIKHFSPEKVQLKISSQFKEIKIPDTFDLNLLSKSLDKFTENTRIYVKTPKVLEAARQHFNCSDCFGMELEHFGGAGSAYSHWSKRFLNTDFMIADIYGEYVISNITLSLFEDSGWYKVNYNLAQNLFWGKNQGCEFLFNKCISPYIPGEQNSLLYDHSRSNSITEESVQVVASESIESSDEVSKDNGNSQRTDKPRSESLTSPDESITGLNSGHLNRLSNKLKNNIHRGHERYAFSNLSKKVNSHMLKNRLKEAIHKNSFSSSAMKNDNKHKQDKVVDLSLLTQQRTERENSPILYTSKFREFCQSEKDSQVCSLSHRFRAKCNVVAHQQSLPVNFQYYHKANLGGMSEFGDYCPFPIEWIKREEEFRFTGSCSVGEVENSVYHETVCKNCRCFHSNMMSKEEAYLNKVEQGKLSKYEDSFSKSAVCYKVFCKINTYEYNRLPIKMMVLVGGIELECPYHGGVVSSNFFYGSFECPPTEDICIGDLNPLSSYEESASYYMFDGLKDAIINYFLNKERN